MHCLTFTLILDRYWNQFIELHNVALFLVVRVVIMIDLCVVLKGTRKYNEYVFL